jgi:hypothetical protein
MTTWKLFANSELDQMTMEIEGVEGMIMGRVRFRSGHVGLSGQKSWPAPPVTRVGRVESGLVGFRGF